MKKTILYSLLVLLSMMYACDPIENRDENDMPITAEELNVTAEPVIVNGKKSNKIVLQNHSSVLSEWNYGVGISKRAVDTVLLVVEGTTTIKFTGLNPDGTYITKEIPVTVEELSFPVPPEWGYLCGSGEKTWVWDETASAVWGNGGYLGCYEPCWWMVSVDEMEGQAPGEGAGAEMVFSLNGATLTKKRTDGTSQSGTFSFDMTKKIDDGNGNIWAKGKLNTKNVTVLAGYVINDNTEAHEYNILSLDDEHMALSVPRAGVSSAWGEATFWVFRKK